MYKGLFICLCVGLCAFWIGGAQSMVGAPIIGLFCGMLMVNLLPASFIHSTEKGASFSAKKLLKAGVILAGGTLSLQAVMGVGLRALPIILFNICLSFAVAYLAGKRMGIHGRVSLLVGGGTAICGGTAIATLTPIIKAKEEEMAYAMTAIFLFDILAALMWPYAAKALALSPLQYGILGGLAISDTSSVTAAGETFNTIMGVAAQTQIGAETMSAGSIAVIVKLTRTVMLVFVVIAVILCDYFRGRAQHGGEAMTQEHFGRSVLRSFPVFVLGFLLMAVLNSIVDFSGISLGAITLSKALSKGYKLLITIAMVKIGYKIQFSDMRRHGLKPLLLGGLTWAAVAVSTLTYVLLMV